MKVKLEGFRDASRQLNEMKKATAQGVGRRSLPVPAEILRAEMEARVPIVTGALKGEIKVQKERARKGRPAVGVIADDIAAVPLEYGNPKGGRFQPAQPFARPALDAKKGEMLDAFADKLTLEVNKAVSRAAKKAAGNA